MMDAMALAWIAKKLGQGTGDVMALIEGPQGQKTGVAGDLASGKIGVDGLVTMEGEGELW